MNRWAMLVTNIAGTVLLLGGIVPSILWGLNYLDVVRPGEDPTEWPILLMTLGLTGIGALLLSRKGTKLGEAFLSWFGKRSE